MIELRDIAVAQGGFSLSGVNLRVDAGEHATLVGPTGSGKTTLLEVIAGLRTPSAGVVRLAGLDVTKLPPAARGVGYVPQESALFGHLRVRDNIAFALRLRGDERRAIDRRVAELAEALDISPLLPRRPRHLSGGERQRVAIARALAHRPKILLLDEPTSALDAATRQRVLDLLRDARLTGGCAVLHATHHPAGQTDGEGRHIAVAGSTLVSRGNAG